jgi:hypothetical protein
MRCRPRAPPGSAAAHAQARTPWPRPPPPQKDAMDELKALLSEDEWDALQQVTSPATYFT